MKGIILAAGLGTRLNPLSQIRPKPAMPFLDRPLIQYSLDMLKQAEIEEIFVNTHHLANSVRLAVKKNQGQKFHQAPTRITFSHEEKILGTAGAIGKIRSQLSDETLVVCNGKIYFEEDITRAINFHHRNKALVTLILVPFSEGDTFNPVFLDEENVITGFGEKSQQTGGLQPYIFSGVQIIDPKALKFFSDKISDTVKNIYPRMIKEGCSLRGFVSDSYWCECSTPKRYLAKSVEVLKRKGLNNILGSGIKGSCDSVIASNSVKIQTGARIKKTILWDEVQVGRNSSLKNVIVADKVKLPSETHLRDAIVVPAINNYDGNMLNMSKRKNYLVCKL